MSKYGRAVRWTPPDVTALKELGRSSTQKTEQKLATEHGATNLKRCTLIHVVIVVLVTLLPAGGAQEAMITAPERAHAGDLGGRRRPSPWSPLWYWFPFCW